jgi:hypothetical protein
MLKLSGHVGVCEHDNAQEKNSRKFEQKKNFFTRYARERKSSKTYTKKRVYAHDTGAGEYQDILDTLKEDY